MVGCWFTLAKILNFSNHVSTGHDCEQCYDKYMMESWKNEAEEKGFTIPCCVGPQTAGDYNSEPDQTQFFQTEPAGLKNGICYSETYGKTFLTWYSNNLVDHGQSVLKIAHEIFNPMGIKIAAKVPGIHWWHGKPSRAAEATAGLFAGDTQNALSVYDNIAKTLESLKAATFIFTCAEMKDDPNNQSDKPQTLVNEVLGVAKQRQVSRACENAAEVTDTKAYDQIRTVAKDNNISYFTYMRLGLAIMGNLGPFESFVKKMNAIRRS
jgi:beta-amylase